MLIEAAKQEFEMQREFDALLDDAPVVVTLVKTNRDQNQQPLELRCRYPDGESRVLSFGDVEAMCLFELLKKSLLK